MIKHHPKFELLQQHVNGELPASLSAGITIHAEMCSKCQETISLLTEQVAELSLGSVDKADIESFTTHSKNTLDEPIIDDFKAIDVNAMIAEITSTDEQEIAKKTQIKRVNFKDHQYALPAVLANMELGNTTNLGKLSRARLQLNEGEIHSSLLHIEPGGSVPEHTHKGFELTVLLAGSFTDDKGEYVKGDFIMLDGSHQHQPVSEQGCLCYTVANDALHFTQGINKLLNPIGALIY